MTYPPRSHTLPPPFRRTLTIFALVLFALAAVASGCGSKSVESQEKYEQTGRLKDFRNELDITSGQAPYPAVVTGTVTKTESTPDGTLMMVKVNTFRIVGSSDSEKSAPGVPAGTEVVIDWHKPEQQPSRGQSVEALVRFVKSSTGLGLVAESVRLTGN